MLLVAFQDRDGSELLHAYPMFVITYAFPITERIDLLKEMFRRLPCIRPEKIPMEAKEWHGVRSDKISV